MFERHNGCWWSEKYCKGGYKSNVLSLIDVIMTTNSNRIASTINTITGLINFHHLVDISTKITVHRRSTSMITYTWGIVGQISILLSLLNNDISTAPDHVAKLFDVLNDRFLFCHTLANDISYEEKQWLQNIFSSKEIKPRRLEPSLMKNVFQILRKPQKNIGIL